MTSDRAPEQGTDLVERLAFVADDLEADHPDAVQRSPKCPQCRAIAALREAAAEITRLRLAAPVWREVVEALRKHCIEEGTEHGHKCWWCHQCGGMWLFPDPEKHEPGCLASPPSEQAAAVEGEE